jgi:hypothetical protein
VIEATVEKIEALLEEHPEASELVQSLMELYGTGLARILELAPDIQDRLAEDKLVSTLLLLHGLHPVDVETRLRQALHRVERGLDAHSIEITGIEDGVAYVRIAQNGGGPPPALVGSAIERAVADAAPDLLGVEIEGLPKGKPFLVQIEIAS